MKRLLSKIEYIVIGLLAILFLMWTATKCNAHRAEAQTDATEQATEDSLAQASQPAAAPATAPASPAPAAQAQSNPAVYQPISPGEGAAQPAAQPGQAASSQSAAPSEAAAAPANASNLSRLYVTIDKLKLRKTPGLKGDLLGELKLFDEVYYMNEATDSLYEVSLGTEKAVEPYVKVKTKRGTVGWVYGAGVHYMKKKRTGVLE